jgi:hypothetical protein
MNNSSGRATTPCRRTEKGPRFNGTQAFVEAAESCRSLGRIPLPAVGRSSAVEATSFSEFLTMSRGIPWVKSELVSYLSLRFSDPSHFALLKGPR